nr:protein L-isoaspartyl methyltransferase 2-2 [Oryza coarctata]
MCLAAAIASASPARCLSPSSALPRGFLHHLLAAPPPRPPPPRCIPFHRMAQFWNQGSLDNNKALVEYLKQYVAVRTDKVAEVMESIDRALFVAEGLTPYTDSPMPIGYNATISAPHLQPGMHALDVGSECRAVGIEHIPELVAASIENVQRSAAAQLLKEGPLSFHVADGRLGWPDEAPYDAIHVGAAAPEIPQPLVDQLKAGGRMVIPVGSYFQELQVVNKKADGSVTVQNDASVHYVPLTSRSAQLQDS